MDRQGLASWHGLNSSSGRQRRTEACERLTFVQALIWQDFDLMTRRCARVEDGDLVAPPVSMVAGQASSGAHDWRGGPQLSRFRGLRILAEFEQCGYIRRTDRRAYRDAEGRYQAAPRAITFTKKFFVELGGESLWRDVLQAGRDALQAARRALEVAGAEIRAGLAALFVYRNIYGPAAAKAKAYLAPRPPPCSR